ncbi:MAG: TonB-dependent receptor [Terracidiphilus sp.]|nr:TonB-dependent receptor [Terracidiphilus sp.]
MSLCLPVQAQTGSGGTIQGTITDQQNAVIEHAQVVVTNVDTGVVSKAQSTSAGYFSVPSLIPGLYQVQVEKKGFKSYVQQNLQVDALQVVGLNVKLSIGETTESVTVTDAPPALETENATLTTSMENETYTDLPLNMSGSPRNPTAFASLAPGAAGGGRLGTFNGAGGYNSDADSGVVVYMDGLQFSTGDNRPLSLAVSVDAVDQFQVTTSGTNAAQTGLGSQNYNIKHGTNAFHGSVYDFLRNTAFDSWGFFAPATTVTQADGTKVRENKPAEHQTEMGLTVGGPLKQNKIFFFVSGELYHYTKFVNPYFQTVPTDNMRAGNFQELCDPTQLASKKTCSYPIYDPTSLTVSGSTYTTQPFNYGGNVNVMNPALISTISKNMLQFLPHANVTGQYKNNLLMSHPTGNSNYEVSERFDFVITPKQRISLIGNTGKQGFIGYDYASNSTLGLPYVNATRVTEFFNSAIFEHTYIFTANLANQFKAGFVRTNTPIKNPSESNPSLYSASTAMGIGNLPKGDASDAFPGVTFSGGEYGASTWYSKATQVDLNTQGSLHDDLSWAHGKHLITGGLDLQAYQKNVSNNAGQAGPLSLTYSSNSTAGFSTNSGTNLTSASGDPFASYLLGGVYSTSLTIQNFTTLGTRYKSFSPYIQDDWKILPNLTLNLGLRWDLYQIPYEAQNRGSYMDPTITNPMTGTAGAMAYLGYGSGQVNRRSPGSTYYKNIGPRAGLAYTLRPGLVVRTGFGINYGRNGYASLLSGTTGLTTKTTYSSTSGNEQPAFYLNDKLATPNTSFPAWSSTIAPTSSVNAGNYCTSSKSSCTASSVSMSAPGTTVRVPTVYNWNLGVEQSLTRKLVMSITYAGSASHFLASKKSYMGTDAKYNVIGQYLGDYPNDMDTTTKQTFLADAQQRFPGITLPYSTYGGSSATISHMLTPYPQYSSVDQMFGPYGDADYHALQTSLKQQSWRGLSYTATFVWSKVMGNTGDYRANGDYIPANIMSDGIARRTDDLEHTLLTGNQRLLFRIYGEYKLPFGTGSLGGNNWYVRQATRGWKVSGIYKLGSGGPMSSPGSSVAYNPNFGGPIKINGKFGSGYVAGMTNAPRYIDINGFVLVPKNMIGNIKNLSVYNLTTPHTSNTDMAIMRSFPIWRQSTFNLRAEVFNLTNHTEFSSPVMSWPSSAGCNYTKTQVDFGQGGGVCTPTSSDTFGRVQGQSNSARDWQFSGRITF